MALIRYRDYPQFDLFFGDIHNHCGVSYGHGTLTEALYNARLQLDFASVTVHAAWPDLPLDDAKLGYLVDYHRTGFARAQAGWPTYLAEIEQQNEDGRFVTFPSFEWHSIAYGDHCVYYKDNLDCPIIDAPDLPALRQAVRVLRTPSLIIPHHIGYKQGSRGINWEAFSNELSPVSEVFSFHGLSEASEGPYPYLHSMGPRHEQSTAQFGWEQGHIFGIIGSTDHHNAFPGSYGYGRMGVWADSLTRDGIWQAINERRTYALTGDRIELLFALNNQPMGSVLPAAAERWIDVAVCGGDSIDYVEVLHNNRVIHRESVLLQDTADNVYKVYIEVGWGEMVDDTLWNVRLQVDGGQILDVEPRFRGYGPTDAPDTSNFAYSFWERVESNRICFQTQTRRNASLHTATTEGLALEVKGTGSTRLQAMVNDQKIDLPLSELFTGSRTYYLGGFVSPALCFHQAVPQAAYTHRFGFMHRSHSTQRDWYYVRVRQRNNQWAWSSPIWVEAPSDA